MGAAKYRAVIRGTIGQAEADAMNKKWPGRRVKVTDSASILDVGEGSKATVTAWAKKRADALTKNGCLEVATVIAAIPREPDCD